MENLRSVQKEIKMLQFQCINIKIVNANGKRKPNKSTQGTLIELKQEEYKK